MAAFRFARIVTDFGQQHAEIFEWKVRVVLPGHELLKQLFRLAHAPRIVAVRWWRWKEVDTYPGDVSLSTPTALVTRLQVPNDARPGQTIQLVLEATDNGSPPLTHYQRVIVSVTR